MAVHNGEL